MKKDGDWRLGRYLFVTYLAVALIPVLLLGVVFLPHYQSDDYK